MPRNFLAIKRRTRSDPARCQARRGSGEPLRRKKTQGRDSAARNPADRAPSAPPLWLLDVRQGSPWPLDGARRVEAGSRARGSRRRKEFASPARAAPAPGRRGGGREDAAAAKRRYRRPASRPAGRPAPRREERFVPAASGWADRVRDRRLTKPLPRWAGRGRDTWGGWLSAYAPFPPEQGPGRDSPRDRASPGYWARIAGVSSHPSEVFVAEIKAWLLEGARVGGQVF